MNTNRYRRLMFSGVLALVGAWTFVTPPAHGFQVKDLLLHDAVLTKRGLPIHEQITRDALYFALAPSGFAITVNGRPIGFTPEALAQLVKANAASDSLYRPDPVVHFDQEEFVAGQRRLSDLKQTVQDSAKVPSSDATRPGGDKARLELGEALHSVQDFYAHTTWVERNQPGLAPLGRAEDLPSAAGLANTCDSSRRLETELTSGWAPFSSTVFGSTTWNFDANGVSKCIHGNPFFRDDAGLNKDGPERNGYDEARLLAIYASRQYVQDIVDELGDDNDSKCRLLGHDPSYCGGQLYSLSGSFVTPIPIDTVFRSIQNGNVTVDQVSSFVRYVTIRETALNVTPVVLTPVHPDVICRVGDSWIPKTYSYSITGQTVAGCDGMGSNSVNIEGGFVLSESGKLDARFYQHSELRASCPSTPSTASSTLDNLQIYSILLSNGSGSFSVSYLSQHSNTGPRGSSSSSESSESGSGLWDAESVSPPALLDSGIYFLRNVHPGEPGAVECGF